ncbi:MAG: hypothetical protein ABI480_00335 [Chitinophagaceae bacterium]
MPDKILTDDWSAYDDRKIRDKRDSAKFSCKESWEVNYLVKIVRRHYPQHTKLQVLKAIESACNNLKTPRVRKEFVEMVMQKLC